MASGIPWKVVVYGDEAQSWMENNTRAYIRRYWAKKTPVKYEDVPFEVVSTRLWTRSSGTQTNKK